MSSRLPQMSPTPYPTTASPVTLPKLGQTRCYWSLLSSDLHFIYLDPVLASHLAEQAEPLVGKSLLSFVHPEEQASAKTDLAGVLQSKHLHGSVTRTRFSRLSRIRRELGYNGPPAPWPDADRIAVDKDYMTVDIVINWAADGLVLCFVHAIADLSPNDNDEQCKSDWSNWCGTPYMDKARIQFLFNRLVVCAQRPSTMARIFQILANDPTRELLLSWPPDQPGHAFLARDFARLVENAKIGNDSDNSQAKTSCTRRYKALQNMPSVIGGQVESIFIPYGSVIFACHKVNSPSRLTPNSPAVMQQVAYNGRTYHSQQHPSYYDSGGPAGPYVLPPLSLVSSAYNPNNYTPQHPPPPYPPQHWPQPSEPPGPYHHWTSSSPAHPASPLPPSATSAPYLEPGTNRPVSPRYPYPSPQDGNDPSPSPDLVPPARRRVSPTSIRGEPYASGNRNSSARPTGVLKCSSCKATSSPEWRKGPSGKKELCNACGLRFARSRAKKEGHSQTQRRRKDKGITKRESGTPPSGLPSYTSMRRASYGDTSFSSAGSNSGSEIYQHPGHHVLDDKVTPSPSPPASGGMGFVHYSPTAGDSRSSYPVPGAPFYSVPSPLSNPPVQLEHHPHPQGNTQLPPLSYVDRLSPMHSSGSPLSHSPLATLPPASFEREREKNRDLPAPLSVEPRRPRRSILTQP